jgi:hypothetical protein
LSSPDASGVRVRLVFVDDGSYHHEHVRISAATLASYDRLVDALQEDQELLSRLHVDMARLCAAFVVDGPEAHEVDG